MELNAWNILAGMPGVPIRQRMSRLSKAVVAPYRTGSIFQKAIPPVCSPTSTDPTRTSARRS